MHSIQKSRQLDFVLEVVGAGAGAGGWVDRERQLTYIHIQKMSDGMIERSRN